MKHSKSNHLFFILLVGVVLCMMLLLVAGRKLDPAAFEWSPGGVESFFHYTLEGVMANSLAMLAIQIVLFILLARALGYLTGKAGLPFVVGEILAGVLLGPSLLGHVFPAVYEGLFPEGSLDHLQIISEFGLVFFMFIVGIELDIRILSGKGKAAMAISHVSILFTFALGTFLSTYMYESLAPENVSFFSFSSFIGTALSIGSFALISLVVQERMLSKVPTGNLAISAAAIDEITGWSILALVILCIRAGSLSNLLLPGLFSGAYIALMFYGVRPILKKIGSVYSSREIFNKKIVGTVFLVLLGSTYLAELIGLHALFGAFLAGLIMPPNLGFKKIMVEKIEDLSVVLFLPLFFVYVGLRTDITALFDTALLGTAALVVAIGMGGKLVGSTMAARWFRQSWRQSVSLGILMNSRGLMTLIAASIGYDLGILSPTIFAMLVLLALISTALVNPMLNVLTRTPEQDFGSEVLSRINATFSVLVSFGAPKMGSTLLRLADQLTLNQSQQVDITALHITPSSQVKPYEAVLYEKEGFQPIRATAQLLGVKLRTLYKNTEDIDKEIVYTVTRGRYDLVLVGAARAVFNKKLTGGKLRQLLEEGETNIGILEDRGFVMAESILLLLGSETDLSLLPYAYRFRMSNRARVTILKMGDGQGIDFKEITGPYQGMVPHFKEVIEQRIPDKMLLSHFNLILVSLEHWNTLNDQRATWIRECPSILVIKHHLDLPLDIPQHSTSTLPQNH